MPVLLGDTGNIGGFIIRLENEAGTILGEFEYASRDVVESMIQVNFSGVELDFDADWAGKITKITGASLVPTKGSVNSAHRCDYGNPLIADAMNRHRAAAGLATNSGAHNPLVQDAVTRSAHAQGRLTISEQGGSMSTSTSELNPLVQDALRRQRY